MSFKSAIFYVFLCFLILLSDAASCWALDVTTVRFGKQADTDRAVIELSAPTNFKAFVLDAPDRVVVDMPNFNWKVRDIQKKSGGLIKDVRYGALGGGKSRVVIETTQPVQIKSSFSLGKAGGQPDRVVVDFVPVSSLNVAKNVNTPEKPKEKPKQKKLIIIDPGHGGQDPGARGVNGRYEKSIVLAVGLELRKQLQDAGYRVEMTRSTDVFIPLRDRVKFARKKGGDLFISLHADSISRDNVKGASVYTLSDTASDKETEKLAERENKSDLIAGIDLSHQEGDVADILIDLAARDTMNQSRYLAKSVLVTFDSHGVETLDGKYRSAGFAVLKAMDIPSILVEMGYLTNRQEVERLSTESYRRKIASALKASVDRYFQKNGK